MSDKPAAAPANDNGPLTITRAQLRELSKLRTQMQELVEAAAQLERDIVTKEMREHLVRTANPSPEMVAKITQRLRSKGVIK